MAEKVAKTTTKTKKTPAVKKEVKEVKAVAPKTDLTSLRVQLRTTLLDIRTGKEKNTAKARNIRKQIARLLTAETLKLANTTE